MNLEIVVNRMVVITLGCLVLLKTFNSPKAGLQPQNAAIKRTSTRENMKWSKTPKSKLASIIMVLTASTLKSKVSQVILVIWVGIIFNEVLSGLFMFKEAGGHNIGSVEAINLVAIDLMLAFGTAIAAMWSWLICWREKQFNFAEIVSTAPVSNQTRLIGQCISLLALVILLVLITALSTLIAELIMGTQIVASQYISQFAVACLPLLILSACFVFIHNIVNSAAKAGLILSAILLVKFTPITSTVGMTNLLWNIGGSPVQEANHFWGFGGSVSVLLPFTFFWGLVTITLYSFAKRLTHRGTGVSQSYSKNRLVTPMLLLAMTAVTGVMFNNQIVFEKPLTYRAESIDWQVNYEKNYKHWLEKAQPTIAHIDSNVELYPNDGKALINLEYTLLNETKESISEILLGRHGNYKNWEVIDGKGFTVSGNDYFQQKLIKLKQELQPGQTIKLAMRIDYQQPVMWPVNSSVVVTEEYSNIVTESFLPVVGYKTSFELDEASLRAQNNLTETLILEREQPKATFSTTISTEQGYSALTQGKLVQHWSLNEREYYKFESDIATALEFVWISVPDENIYEMGTTPAIEVYTPATYNIGSDVAEVFTDLFEALQAYLNIQHTEKLQIVSTPDLSKRAYATSGLILYDFDNLLKNVSYENKNLVFIYHQLVSSVFDSFVLNTNATSDPLVIELLKGQALLEVVEQKFGAEARKKVLNDAVRKYKLLTITRLNKDVSYFTEKLTPESSVRAVLLAQVLEKLLGKEQLKKALFHHLWDINSLNHEQFLEFLKRNRTESINAEIDQIFSGDTLELTSKF